MKTTICSYSPSDLLNGNIELIRNNYIRCGCDSFNQFNFNDMSDLIEENYLLSSNIDFFEKSKLYIPVILQQMMNKVKMNDYLVYSNTNLIIKTQIDSLNFKSKDIDIFSDDIFNSRVISYSISNSKLIFKNNDFTPQSSDDFKNFVKDNSDKLLANLNWIVLKKTNKNLALLNEWLFLSKFFYLKDLEKNSKENTEVSTTQGILTLLLMKYYPHLFNKFWNEDLISKSDNFELHNLNLSSNPSLGILTYLQNKNIHSDNVISLLSNIEKQ